MTIKRDNLLTDLKGSVIEFTFEIDGKREFMRCTLREDVLPTDYSKIKDSVASFHAANPTVIAAWDVSNKRWRSFDADAIKYSQDVNDNY